MTHKYLQFLNHDNQLTSTQRHRCCDSTVMAADAVEDEELRFCFNIDLTEDEFYQNNGVNIFGSVNLRPCSCDSRLSRVLNHYLCSFSLISQLSFIYLSDRRSLKIHFCSDRSSRNADLRPFSLSGALNLYLSRLEKTLRAL